MLRHCGETHEFVLMVVKTYQQHKGNLWQTLWQWKNCQKTKTQHFAKGNKASCPFSYLKCILLFNVISIKVVKAVNLQEAETQHSLSSITNILVLFSYNWALLWHSEFLLLFIANGTVYESRSAINLVCTPSGFTEFRTADCWFREPHHFLILSWTRQQRSSLS